MSRYLLLGIPDEAKVILDEIKVIPAEPRSRPHMLNGVVKDETHIPDDRSGIHDAAKHKCNRITGIPSAITFVSHAINSICSGSGDIHAEGTVVLCDLAYIPEWINSIPDRAGDIGNGWIGMLNRIISRL